MGEPAGVFDDVELVAVDDQHFFAVRHFMDDMVDHLDAAELHAEKVAGEFVVIAGDEDHAGSLAHPAQEFLHDVIMGLRPVPPRLRRQPSIMSPTRKSSSDSLCLRKSSNRSAWQPLVPR